MNRKIKAAAASFMSAAMVLSMTACSEEGDPEITTYADYGPLTEYISTIVDDYKASLSGTKNADIEVTKKIKYLGWWAIDETQASAVLFKQVYGVPDEASGSGIFDYTNVAYGDRYTKLTALVTSGDSPDIFQFEMGNYPYTAAKDLFQPIDDVIDLNTPLWERNREIMDKFKWNGRDYCAITTINLDTLLWYRKSVIAENNLDDPYELFKSGNWNWNTFLDMCAKFSNPDEGKYCIDGWAIPEKFVATTGVPMISLSSEGKLECNFYNADIERCMTTVVDQMFKQNYRYPRHELNGWGINQGNFVSGDTLFWGSLGYTIKDDFQGTFKREGWEDGEMWCVPIPKDPNSDKYYQCMKNDSWMLCGGAQNKEGFAAWNLCCMATAFDKEAEKVGDEQMMHNNLGFTQELLDHMRSLQFDGVLTPVFDFKNGIGQDVVEGTADDPITSLTEHPYLDGKGGPDGADATFSSLREANYGTVMDRIDKLNAGTI